jgi:hypothetical protein
MSRPIPVPSECFDMTPSELWPVYWEEYSDGTELPAAVPRAVWEKQWVARNKGLAETVKPPAPPPLWKSYWGKLRDPALRSRQRKRDSEDALPPVFPARLSRRFWDRYFELFPDGHRAPEYAPQPSRPWEQDPEKYKLVRGSLHVFDRGMWRPSTGVDKWNADGSWGGAG